MRPRFLEHALYEMMPGQSTWKCPSFISFFLLLLLLLIALFVWSQDNVWKSPVSIQLIKNIHLILWLRWLFPPLLLPRSLYMYGSSESSIQRSAETLWTHGLVGAAWTAHFKKKIRKKYYCKSSKLQKTNKKSLFVVATVMSNKGCKGRSPGAAQAEAPVRVLLHFSFLCSHVSFT